MVGCKGPAFGPVFAVPACVCPGDVSLEFAKEVMIFRFQPCKAAGRLFENADASFAHYGIEELSSSACQDSQQEDRQAFKCKPQAALKALSWFHRKGQIASLSHLCLNPLVQAFSKEDGPSDRREAMPLPLAVIVAWETKIREPTCPPALALLLGGFLLASHCSLRFGDLQRICVSSLTISSDALRGCCWISLLCLTFSCWAGLRCGSPSMYSGVLRGGGPPGCIFKRLYSLHGGAEVARPIQPLQHNWSKLS